MIFTRDGRKSIDRPINGPINKLKISKREQKNEDQLWSWNLMSGWEIPTRNYLSSFPIIYYCLCMNLPHDHIDVQLYIYQLRSIRFGFVLV